MKISCNIIEDLLPLYVDDMVSEDSRQLVEEHLKECTTCQKMMEEMKKENSLGHGKEGLADVERKAIEPLKKIRRKIRRKRIAAVLMAAYWWRQPVELDITGTMTKKAIFHGRMPE